MAFVGRCGELAGFDEVRQFDRSPLGADPLWLVVATKAVRGIH
jgi:hypothetical protein